MIGTTLRGLPAVQMVKECLDSGRLGEMGLLRLHRWLPVDLENSPSALLRSEGTRAIDLACWFFGERPTLLYAAGRTNYVQAHLSFERGGMALLDHAQTLPPGGIYFSLSLIGSTGAAYADDHHNTQLLFGRNGPAAFITGQSVEPLPVPVAELDHWRAVQVAEAAAVSLATGKALRWTGQQYELVEP